MKILLQSIVACAIFCLISALPQPQGSVAAVRKRQIPGNAASFVQGICSSPLSSEVQQVCGAFAAGEIGAAMALVEICQATKSLCV
ncbi:hypothetical protein BDQ17DRAFT_1439441 [Cyathus striatus]|nr:hypothetical protein BDQ17DRAFT_1439441 [Cyathus striatus]